MSQVISSSAPPVLEPIAISDAGVEIHSSAVYVPQLVSAWAYKTPTAVAVTCGGEELTYADLEARSTDLAWHLSSAGLTTGGLVGLYVERLLEMVIGPWAFSNPAPRIFRWILPTLASA